MTPSQPHANLPPRREPPTRAARTPHAIAITKASHPAGLTMDPDQARLLPRYRLEQQQARALTLHTPPDTPLPTRTYTATAGGDHQALRGIPAIGRGVQGHINGTHPEHQATR